MFVIGDGGKHGNQAAIMAAFTNSDGAHVNKVAKTLYAFYNEEDMHCASVGGSESVFHSCAVCQVGNTTSRYNESAPHATQTCAHQFGTMIAILCYQFETLEDVQARRDVVRGNLSMEQSEQFHFVASSALAASKRDRLHTPKATTAGTCIGPMPLQNWSCYTDVWHMSFKDKKAIYGDARILPGGRPGCDQDLAGSGAQRVTHVRKDIDIEPVTYNGLHRKMFEEMTHQVGKVRAIVDLTATEPTLALMALEWNIPCLGVVFNELHKVAIKKRLAELVFQKFQDPNSPSYEADLASLMQGKEKNAGAHDDDDDDGNENPLPDPKRRKLDVRTALLGQPSNPSKPPQPVVDCDEDDEFDVCED